MSKLLLTFSLALMGFGAFIPETSAVGRMSMEGLTATGKTEFCVQSHRIEETKVIDNSTILFRMIGNKYYLNKLPSRCPSLKIEGGFSYSLGGTTKLCSPDIIRVISTTNTVGTACPLGEFEEMTRAEVPKEAPAPE